MGNIKPSFGDGLKRARKAAGYKTQQVFADKYHKSLDTIQNWEQGKTLPSMGDFIDLCDFFDCDADYLLGTISEKTHDLEFLCSETGLSSSAINVLQNLRDKRHVRAYIDLLSCIITDPDFEYLLGLLEGYFEEREVDSEVSMSRFEYRQKDLAIFAASHAIQNIMDRVKPFFMSQYLTTEQRLEEYFEKAKKPILERRLNNGREQ